MVSGRPVLVLVSGAPASGKTTLAPHLARALGLPLLPKDGVKDILLDTLGAPDRARSSALSRATYALLFAMTGWLLDADAGIIVECNFRRGLSEQHLRPLVNRSRAVLLHCWTTREEIIRRYRQRVARAERHPGHFDALALSDLDAGTDDDAIVAPLDLAIPTLHIETTDGYCPALESIIAFVQAATAPPE